MISTITQFLKILYAYRQFLIQSIHLIYHE